MRTLTAETLPRHELNGLRVRVAAASDPGLVGVAGRVVLETERTLHVESVESVENGESVDGADGDSDSNSDGATGLRVRQIPKRDATFEFALKGDRSVTDGRGLGPAGTEPETPVVTVTGERLLARPARRTERTGDPKWR